MPAASHVEGGMYISPEFQLGQVYDGTQDNDEDIILYRPEYVVVSGSASSPEHSRSQKQSQASASNEQPNNISPHHGSRTPKGSKNLAIRRKEDNLKGDLETITMNSTEPADGSRLSNMFAATSAWNEKASHHSARHTDETYLLSNGSADDSENSSETTKVENMPSRQQLLCTDISVHKPANWESPKKIHTTTNSNSPYKSQQSPLHQVTQSKDGLGYYNDCSMSKFSTTVTEMEDKTLPIAKESQSNGSTSLDAVL